MKVHYINILLFAHALNILVNTQKKNTFSTHHIQTNRSLCECDLYIPNYDSDPQMKEVMDNFNKQTQQRLRDYDDRMKEKRMQCKEQCDKEIQKIILKDKLEKELMDKFATLDTDIQNDAIPTCICEKSIADKVEKGCLRCGGVLGGGVAPGWGLVSGLGYEAWLNVATASAIDFATQEGIKAGVQAVIAKMETNLAAMLSSVKWSNFINGSNYSTTSGIFEGFKNAVDWCQKAGKLSTGNKGMVGLILDKGEEGFGTYVSEGTQAYTEKFAAVKVDELGKVTTQGTQLSGTIGYSVLAIIIIVFIMVIIYLILRYRRKKKMKKKLQYIKLLEE
ncbi:PIR protein [Plasmodium sp. DRC-Itaito]|nr:PIR protein [Plasmodium sp. DRC-Itaito]